MRVKKFFKVLTLILRILLEMCIIKKHEITQFFLNLAPKGSAIMSEEKINSLFPKHKKKILLLGTCAAEVLTQKNDVLDFEWEHYLYESYTHSQLPEFDLSSYEAIVVQPTLRHFIHQIPFPGNAYASVDTNWSRLDTPDDVSAYIECAKKNIDAFVERLRPLAEQKTVLILSMIEPRKNYLGILINPYAWNSPLYLVRAFNEKLYNAAEKVKGIYIIDINEIFSSTGRMHVQDDAIACMSHASYFPLGGSAFPSERIQGLMKARDLFDVEKGRSDTIGAVQARISDALEVIEQKEPIKLIITDLDDTLWNGIGGEDDKPDYEYTEDWPLGYMEALLIYKKRGGLLAICSKNDHETIERIFPRRVANNLSLDDFVSVKINYKPKSENIKEILSEVNILPENVLFIDDNPRETEEVKLFFPKMRTLSTQYLGWRNNIISSPYTQVPVITRESTQRTNNIKAKIARDAEQEHLSHNEWLAGLGINCRVCTIESVEDSQFTRAFELVNKTNQFNTTGKRWSLSEIQKMFSEGTKLIVISVKDKHADNGLVGVAILKGDTIYQTVLSCRVFNLGVEIVLGAEAVKQILKFHPEVYALFNDTGRNKSCFDYYDRMGFVRDGEKYKTSNVPKNPNWIDIC